MGLLSARNMLLLTSIIHKSKLRNVQPFYNIIYRFHTNNKKLTNVDIIDEFTVQLVKEKARKWSHTENQNTADLENVPYTSPWKMDFKSKLKKISEYNKLNIDISALTLEQVDSLILSALDSEELCDVEHLICQCLQNEQCPSMEVILEVLSAYSFHGNVKMITSLQKLYQSLRPELTSANSDFNHYLAKAHWMKGNVEKGLEMFVDVYENNSDIRQTIRNMLKYLINDTVSNRSEASVVVLRRYAKLFGEKWSDWYPMACFWECCWLSEWFGDQQLADALFKECTPLRNVLRDKYCTLTGNALKDHQEDAVIRLLQLILAFDTKHSYSRVISVLFDYRYKESDYRGCIEIMHNCVPLKIKLSVIQNEKFMKILISNGFRCPPITPKKNLEKKNFPFKF